MKVRKTLQILSCVLLGAMIISVLRFCGTKGDNTKDISDLQIGDLSQTCDSIDFEDAVELETTLSETIDKYAEESLRKIENEIHEQTGEDATYWKFIGTFPVNGIDGIYGKLTALIITAEDHIYEIRTPITEINEIQTMRWTQMDVSTFINEDGKSARLAAMGYITMITDSQSEIDSNTLYPAFVVNNF